jgi:hypothetical protein
VFQEQKGGQPEKGGAKLTDFETWLGRDYLFSVA